MSAGEEREREEERYSSSSQMSKPSTIEWWKLMKLIERLKDFLRISWLQITTKQSLSSIYSKIIRTSMNKQQQRQGLRKNWSWHHLCQKNVKNLMLPPFFTSIYKGCRPHAWNIMNPWQVTVKKSSTFSHIFLVMACATPCPHDRRKKRVFFGSTLHMSPKCTSWM